MTRALVGAPLALLLAACGLDLASPSADLRFAAVSAGGAHTCALDEDGGAWCWGANGVGQLGVSTRARDRLRPVAVAGGRRFREISAGDRHTCAIDLDGRGWCWGSNDAGQLGDGSWDDRSAPAAVRFGSRLLRIDAGVGHTCATDTGGRIWCWGRNDDGELGAGSGPRTHTPVTVTGAPPASDVAVGARHSCALGDAGAFCWGENASLQLGAATITSSPLPVRVSSSATLHRVVAGARHSCALTATAQILCWGANDLGQLGVASGVGGTPLVVPVPAAFALLSASSAGDATCGAEIGGIWCWGAITDDRLGEVRTLPAKVRGIVGVVSALSVGGGHACAVAGGRIWCWGRGDSGQLGNGGRAASADAVAL